MSHLDPDSPLRLAAKAISDAEKSLERLQERLSFEADSDDQRYIESLDRAVVLTKQLLDFVQQYEPPDR